MTNMIVCPGCGRWQRHEAKGLCRMCHNRERAAARGDEWKPCPSCGVRVRLRADGSFGRHTYDRFRESWLCPQGVIGQKPDPAGRRVAVFVEAVVPMELSERDFRTSVAALLRRELDSLIVSVETDGAA